MLFFKPQMGQQETPQLDTGRLTELATEAPSKVTISVLQMFVVMVVILAIRIPWK